MVLAGPCKPGPFKGLLFVHPSLLQIVQIQAVPHYIIWPGGQPPREEFFLSQVITPARLFQATLKLPCPQSTKLPSGGHPSNYDRRHRRCPLVIAQPTPMARKPPSQAHPLLPHLCPRCLPRARSKSALRSNGSAKNRRRSKPHS